MDHASGSFDGDGHDNALLWTNRATTSKSGYTNRLGCDGHAIRSSGDIPVERPVDDGVGAATDPDITAVHADDEFRVVADLASLADHVATCPGTRGLGFRQIG